MLHTFYLKPLGLIHKEVKEKKTYNKEVAKSKWDLERGRVQI
jgi:hypothetical protein